MTEARIISPTQYQEIRYIESGSAQRVKLPSRFKPRRFLPAETWKNRQPGEWLLTQLLKLSISSVSNLLIENPWRLALSSLAFP
jgi:hypothetical protein